MPFHHLCSWSVHFRGSWSSTGCGSFSVCKPYLVLQLDVIWFEIYVIPWSVGSVLLRATVLQVPVTETLIAVGFSPTSYTICSPAFLSAARWCTNWWDYGLASRLISLLAVPIMVNPGFLPTTTASKWFWPHCRMQSLPAIRYLPPKCEIWTLSFLSLTKFSIA